jgi:integrase
MIMKNETELTTPTTPELLAALKYYLGQNTVKAAGPVFRKPGNDAPRKRHAFYKWWHACLEVVGMPTDKRLGFHSFRRRLASDLAGAPLPVLMALGGWRNPEVVVKAYATPSMDALKAVLMNRAAFAEGHLTSNRDRLISGPAADFDSDGGLG